jgi:tRNA(Ile)-lysidine synthase
MKFDSKVFQTIKKYNLIAPGDKIMVMVSGGKDSLALLHWLEAQRVKLKVDLAVFHLQHRLRGSAADLDETLVRDTCVTLQLPYFRASFPVRILCRRLKLSLEEGARWVRYLTAGLAASAWGADKVATAHTLDDQAETFLMRVLQGAGTGALGGIHPRLGKWIRPLLEISSSEVLDYCRTRAIPFREDSSNFDLKFLRNKVRHCLLPFIEKEFNLKLKSALARSAEILRQEDAYLNAAAQTLFKAEAACSPGQAVFKVKFLKSLPAVLQRRLLRLGIMRIKTNLKDISLVHVTALINLLDKASGKRLTLPGKLTARREFDRLIIERARLRANPKAYALKFPGSYELPDWNLILEGQWLTPPLSNLPGSNWEAFLDADTLKAPLVLRSRKAGDRFYPLGLGGKKKLKKFFMEKKIPLNQREVIPIVTMADETVWIIGYALDERFKLTPATRRILHLRAEFLVKPPQA